MRTNRSMPPSTIIPVLGYPDVPQAVAWLCHTFGFAEWLRIGSHRVQLKVGDAAVVVTGDGVPDVAPATSHSLMVRVDDVTPITPMHRPQAPSSIVHPRRNPTASANTR